MDVSCLCNPADIENKCCCPLSSIKYCEGLRHLRPSTSPAPDRCPSAGAENAESNADTLLSVDKCLQQMLAS